MSEQGDVRPANEELLAAADRNMARLWRGVAEAVAGPGAVVERDEVLLLSAGVPHPVFNPAFVSKPPTDPAGVADEVSAHYEDLGMPFSLNFRDAVAPGLAAECAARGMVEHWQAPLMLLDPIPDVAPPGPDELEVVGLDAGRLDTYVQVLGEGFGMRGPMLQRVFGAWLLDFPSFTGFLGLWRGAPVATSALFVSDGLAGVYNVATVPEHRGRGIGAAMTWAAASAGRRAELTTSILQASSAGEPVYRAMGYTTPDRYRQFGPS